MVIDASPSGWLAKCEADVLARTLRIWSEGEEVLHAI